MVPWRRFAATRALFRSEWSPCPGPVGNGGRGQCRLPYPYSELFAIARSHAKKVRALMHGLAHILDDLSRRGLLDASTRGTMNVSEIFSAEYEAFLVHSGWRCWSIIGAGGTVIFNRFGAGPSCFAIREIMTFYRGWLPANAIRQS